LFDDLDLREDDLKEVTIQEVCARIAITAGGEIVGIAIPVIPRGELRSTEGSVSGEMVRIVVPVLDGFGGEGPEEVSVYELRSIPAVRSVV